MASTNKTTNLQLNQWLGTDPVLREDFNYDNSRIDAAMKDRALVRLTGASVTAATTALTGNLMAYDLTKYMELQVWVSPKLSAGGTVTFQAESEAAVTLGTLPAGNAGGVILHLMMNPGGLGGWWMAPGGTGTVTGSFSVDLEPLDLVEFALALSGGESFLAGTSWGVYGVLK